MEIITGICLLVFSGLILLLGIKSGGRNISSRLSCASVIVAISGLSMIGTSAWKFISISLFPPTPTPIRALSNYISPTGDPTTECILYHSCIQPTKARATPEIAYHPITWMELNGFLQKDTTNINSSNTYDLNFNNCLDFSVTLVENANKQDIKAWVVIVEFTDGSPGHAFVGFQTTDLGIVFIEPQLDIRTNDPVVGKPLCLSWGDYECMGKIKSVEYDQCDHSHECTVYRP
jgi:hypothetical protein